MVANKSPEKARDYLSQVTWDQRLNASSKGHEGNTPFFSITGVGLRAPDEKKCLFPTGLEPGTSRSAVQYFNEFATRHAYSSSQESFAGHYHYTNW